MTDPLDTANDLSELAGQLNSTLLTLDRAFYNADYEPVSDEAALQHYRTVVHSAVAQTASLAAMAEELACAIERHSADTKGKAKLAIVATAQHFGTQPESAPDADVASQRLYELIQDAMFQYEPPAHLRPAHRKLYEELRGIFGCSHEQVIARAAALCPRIRRAHELLASFDAQQAAVG